MKKLVLVLSFSLVLAVLGEDRQQWLSFKMKHGKTYSNLQEEQLRFSIFQQNLHKIEQHNIRYEAGQETYQMGVNQFADMSNEEYLSILTRQANSKPAYRLKSKNSPSIEKSTMPVLPESIDWREMGAVTSVKNQGTCGCCWAFSAVGTLESFYYLMHKRVDNTTELTSFSVQQLVDCDNSNDGCNGGEEAPALNYVKQYGIETEASYPYEGIKGTCRYNKTEVFTIIENYIPIESGDEDTLEIVVGFLGPTSVALDASGLPFYMKGIFTSSTCSQKVTNHAVLAVGYGHDEDTGLDYWLVKNSWGEGWGEEGYFKIKKGSNECAIAMDSVYPSYHF